MFLCKTIQIIPSKLRQVLKNTKKYKKWLNAYVCIDLNPFTALSIIRITNPALPTLKDAAVPSQPGLASFTSPQ